MTITDIEILSLLYRLDNACHSETGYPPFGLPLYGDLSRSQHLVDIVRAWLTQVSAEAQR